jgi:predicted NBD/HSP70 family sugar kinase
MSTMAVGSPSKLRILNDQAALKFIVEAGVVSRAELEQLTGLSKPAVAELLIRLEAVGLVEKSGKRNGSPGPAAQLWSIRADAGYVAAADITSSGIHMLISDLTGQERVRVRWQWTSDPAPVQVRKCLDLACQEAGLAHEQLLQVVVGLPGALDPRTGLLKYAPHLPRWEGYDVMSVLRAELDIDTEVENDVNLMALSEMNGGLAEAADDFALVWIDEGVGAAVIIGRQLFRGLTGAAGEIDYLPVPDRAVVDTGTDRFGTKLGDLLSPIGILDLARAHGLTHTDPVEALKAALRDRISGQGFLEDFAMRIATGLAAVTTVLDPELIMLGGKFGAVGGDDLAGLVQEKLSIILTAPPSSTARILSYPITDDAALSGALRVALTRARDKAFESGSVVAEPTSDSSRKYNSGT